MKQERSKVKSDILLRVRLLYVLFILAGAIVLARLVWVQLFSAEVAYNADRLASRIFTEEVIPAQRGSILSRDGEPLATSIFRYQAAFDFASPGLDSLKTFREQADSLAKLLAAFFRDKPASAYAKRFREEHARRYRLVNPRDTSYLRSEGWISRMMDRMRGEEYVKRRIYDTIRDHTPVNIFPREVDFAEWESLRRYPLLNWNMGMVYRLIERDERIYPQGELARRTIGLTGDKGNYGIEEAYREELAGRDGKALRQRIARGFYGRVAGGDHEDPVDGFDIVTTLDLDLQDVADKALRRQLEAQNALWGTTIVMEVHTGEILAMVNLGRNADGSFAERENYALGRSMEPGSTFKLATMLTLLDDARMPVSTVYDTHNGDPVTVGPARNIRDSHRGDRVEERFESRTIASSIASRAALREVQQCLQAVCTEGTASAFFRDTTRLRVAAKTGTAQITDARSREGRYYLGSMVAYFPADAPRYTVLTTIETRAQAGKAYYGGPLAGPVVKRMVDYIFNRGRDWYGRVDDGGPRRYPDRMKGGDIAQVRRVADRLSPRASFESRTGWGRVAVDSLSNVVITSLPGDRGVMPDVRGMGLKDALFVLESRGLKVRFSGRGAVTQQSITAGARIAPGTAVVITLK